MAALVDTNVLVYRYDGRDARKQEIARELLRNGVADRSLRIAHQAVIEFYAVVTRGRKPHGPLMTGADASREAAALLETFDVAYPDEIIVRIALEGVKQFQMAWFDAHMWAYAEVLGMETFFTEDLEHGRKYGSVRVINPFF